MTHHARRLGLIAVLCLSAFAACAKRAKHEEDGPRPAVAQKASPTSPTPAGNAPTQDAAQAEQRKIIRTGSVRITVSSYDEARAKLDAMLQQVGGYVDSTQVSRGEHSVTDATIVVRLPATKFGDIVPKLRELGDVTTETTDAADITEQYIDTSARLASAQALEKRLLEIAAERNGTIESLLAVERELTRVRGEIEGYEAHMRRWDDQVAMSTLTLTLSTRMPEIVASTSFTGRVSQTFHESIHALREFGGWLVVFLVAVAPWALIVLVTLLAFRRLDRSGTVAKLRQKFSK
jgi:hypothetical protein